MPITNLEVRVKSLEETQRSLRELPGRMDAFERRMDAFERRMDAFELELLDMRSEMTREFSAIREALVETNRHMRVLHEEVLARIAAIQHG